jgi:hypothetical protein
MRIPNADQAAALRDYCRALRHPPKGCQFVGHGGKTVAQPIDLLCRVYRARRGRGLWMNVEEGGRTDEVFVAGHKGEERYLGCPALVAEYFGLEPDPLRCGWGRAFSVWYFFATWDGLDGRCDKLAGVIERMMADAGV